MKRGKKLLILLVCLALVALAAWGLSQLFAPDAGTPMTPGDTIFALGDTAQLSWQYEENEITFQISGGRWVNPQDETYEIDPLYQANILDQLENVTSKKIIEQPGDPADFGLDAPICTITADDTQIRIGNAATIGNYRYLSLGDGKVYMVSDLILSPFTKSLAQMVKKEALPDLKQMTAVTVTTQAEAFELVVSADQAPVLQAGAETPAVNEEVAQGLIQHLQALKLTDCAAWNPEDLAAYGLDQPVISYELHYLQLEQADSVTLLLGQANGNIYAMLEGGCGVYTLDLTVGTVLAEIQLSDLTV